MTDKQGICLALDTALDACSVGLAISTDQEVRTYGRSLDLGRGHAEHLMAELEALLQETNLGYQDLTRLAVTTGPGSFTGLRVGLATARSLALALEIPLIGVSTLKALELTARHQGHVGPLACVIDARRNQIYGQLFLPDRPSEPAALAAIDFAAQCLDETGQAHADLLIAGSGVELIKKEQAALADCPFADFVVPDMAVLAQYGLIAADQQQNPAPLYLRAPDAKPQASKAIARL